MTENKSSVYNILRKKIVNLDLKPGEEIDIKEFSKKLGVSRSPLRDALLRLASDKLVDIFPQKGTRVALLNKEIIRQERFMRINLELSVLEECMRKIEDNGRKKILCAKMQTLLITQHASLMDDDKIGFFNDDDEMHHLIYQEAECEWIWETLVSRTGNDSRIRVLSCELRGISDKIETEHKNLVGAIFRGNIEEAVRLEKEHLTRLYEEIEELEKNYPQYFEC